MTSKKWWLNLIPACLMSGPMFLIAGGLDIMGTVIGALLLMIGLNMLHYLVQSHSEQIGELRAQLQGKQEPNESAD